MPNKQNKNKKAGLILAHVRLLSDWTVLIEPVDWSQWVGIDAVATTVIGQSHCCLSWFHLVPPPPPPPPAVAAAVVTLKRPRTWGQEKFFLSLSSGTAATAAATAATLNPKLANWWNLQKAGTVTFKFRCWQFPTRRSLFFCPRVLAPWPLGFHWIWLVRFSNGRQLSASAGWR